MLVHGSSLLAFFDVALLSSERLGEASAPWSARMCLAITGHSGPSVLCRSGPPGLLGAISLAGIGGSAFNPNTGHFLVTNSNATPDLTVGTVDEIDPGIGTTHGPVVVNSFIMPNCMPTSIVQGPGNNFLVGCGDHDGEAFPPNEYVIDGTSGEILATITNVGGVDEIWYNSGDNRYYLAAQGYAERTGHGRN